MNKGFRSQHLTSKALILCLFRRFLPKEGFFNCIKISRNIEAGWEYGEILDTIEYYYYAQPGGEDYVWIPASGTLYHSRSDCSGMRSPTYEPVTDELLRRYRPCSKCWSY